MAHHGRTPQSMLDAPKLTPVVDPGRPAMITTRTGADDKIMAIGRRGVRAYDRAVRLSRPKAPQEPRIRPERITTPEARYARAVRREAAQRRRAEQKLAADAAKAARTARALAAARTSP